MSQISKTEFAAQIVDQMGDEDRASYRRDDWAEGLGLQMEGDENYSLEELLDAVDDLIAQETTMSHAPLTLDDLLANIKTGSVWDGAPIRHGEIDWSSLPTFGGAEPSSTIEVLSWDSERLLVGTCVHNLEIVSR